MLLTINNNRVLFLHNPSSNEGWSDRLWVNTRKRHPYLPEHPLNIYQVKNLQKLINTERPDIVAISGGDGTVNHIGRTILGLTTQPLLSILPFGFGNALAYCLGVETVDKALDVLQNPVHTLAIDVLKLNCTSSPIGLFNLSIGYDARIVHYRQNYRYVGLRSYVLSAIRGFLDHKPKELVITIDEHTTIRAISSSLMVANCPIIGKNYVVADHAMLDDGLLDCTLFSTKYAYLTNLRLHGFRHPLYSKHGQVHFKARSIRVEGEPYLQVDGDPISHTHTLNISLSPKALRFLRSDSSRVTTHHIPYIESDA